MSSGVDHDLIVSSDEFGILNPRQKDMWSGKLSRFADYLLEEGKAPHRNNNTDNGYSEKSVKERISRFHRAVKWVWANYDVQTEITTTELDAINEALECDDLRGVSGDAYAEDSKRKINDVLQNWAEFQGYEWSPEYAFSGNGPDKENKPDPFSKKELVQLWETALTYKSIPSYNNLTPAERDQWKAHIAQELGKPKDGVVPDDWERINNDWHVPSLIRTARSQGWRPDIMDRMRVDWYDSDTQAIHIPAGEAPKNDAPWTARLTDEGAHALENWLEQRKLMELYDDSELIWLTREGNPYSSGSLNNLLQNLMEEAGINARGRKLVWYSFRHSIGTYVFAETKSLRAVADKLRQKSRDSAEKYVHQVPEVKKELSELL
jgi:integrase